jgi:dihydrolipoamide dehydrogenase
MNAVNQFEITVIGSGPGGYVAAARAAQLGMRTALVERDSLGGVCLNWGCIPTKALLESAHAWNVLREARKYGLSCSDPAPNFPDIIARSRMVADRMSKGVGFLLKTRNVTVIKGSGKVAIHPGGRPGLLVNGNPDINSIETDHLILATGGRPMPLPGVPFDGDRILNAYHAMSLETLPKSLIVIGAGAIGMEFASFYRAFGVDITLIEMLPQILPAEDEDIIKELLRVLRRQKMTVLTRTKVARVETDSAEGVIVHAEGPGGQVICKAEKLLVAIGIQPNLDELGLEKTGIEMNRGFVKTDAFGKTNIPGVYAIGDLAGPPLLAHKASSEALACVDAIAGLNSHPVETENIPGCVYCIPQIASVGMTEKTAIERGIDAVTGSFPFRANGRSVAMGETDGMVKLIFDRGSDMKLIGAHILHAMASELIAELGIVLTMKGSAHDIARTIHAHPTLSEAVMEAAEDALGRPVHK